MARKSLSAQVMDEVDRARGVLSSTMPLLEPLAGALLEGVSESLQRIEGMCLRARQADVNSILADPPAPEVMTRATGPADGPQRGAHRASNLSKRGTKR